MSFWSKLGLADAATIAELKEEILSLRQENNALHDAQSKHAQQLCDSCTDCMKAATTEVKRRTSGLEEQLRILQPSLASSLRESQQEILSAGNAHQKHMMCQVSAILENQELFKNGISSITTSQEKALAQIVELLNAIMSIQNQTGSKLSNVCHMISDEIGSLKDAAQVQNSISKKMEAQLGSEQIELQKILTEAQTVVEDISFLKKYTESLWEAMKLVWINDLLDDAQK